MNHEVLHVAADCASILTCVIAGVTSVIGLYQFFSYRKRAKAKVSALELYLLRESLGSEDEGKRTVLRIIKDLGLTETEIFQASFKNPRIGRFVRPNREDGLAKDLLLGYIPEG